MNSLTLPQSYSKSWGANVTALPDFVQSIRWEDQVASSYLGYDKSFIPYGLGRSYGDLCLNAGAGIFATETFEQIISWDAANGLIELTSGCSLAHVISFALPQGWFLPVTPGTKFVTIGGAIASDVHGKNHHHAGTFGCFVKSLRLMRSDGSISTCSPTQNKELFRATIGGMGLTGFILSAVVQLKFASPWIEVEALPFRGIQEFTELSKASQQYEYTVAWLDCVNAWSHWGRGILLRGQHFSGSRGYEPPRSRFSIPCAFPSFSLNRFSVKAFNELYYLANKRNSSKQIQNFDSYFYPLDGVLGWNKIYGKNGFFQFQLVVPMTAAEVLEDILDQIARSGFASFLAVLKCFGDVASPGLMSFPKEGYTLTLDFANRGKKTYQLLDNLTQLVKEAGGRLYPAKDSTMKPTDFACFYKERDKFSPYIDARHSSNFSRRVDLT